MVNQSIISALRAEIKALEEKKREIEEQHRALVTTLRHFEDLNTSPRSQPSSHRPSERLVDGKTESHNTRSVGRGVPVLVVYQDGREKTFESAAQMHRTLAEGTFRTAMNARVRASKVIDSDGNIVRVVRDDGTVIKERNPRPTIHESRHFQNSYDSTIPDPAQPTTPSDGLRNAISEILIAEGGPLHRRVIHSRLVESGVRIGGQDPVNNVGAHLSLDPRFRSIGDGVWDLVEADDQYEEDEDEDEESVPW